MTSLFVQQVGGLQTAEVKLAVGAKNNGNIAQVKRVNRQMELAIGLPLSLSTRTITKWNSGASEWC